MEDYKKKLGILADKIKNETPKTPIQHVLPVKATTPVHVEDEEARFNNWIPRWLKRAIKAYGAQNDISQKEITIQALTLFLKDKGSKGNA